MIRVTIQHSALARFEGEVHKSMWILNKLRDAGIPAVGALSVLYVERGTLTQTYDSLLGTIEYTWTS